MPIRKYSAFVVLWASAVSAFRDTSPFFLFSSSGQFSQLSEQLPQIVASTDISSKLSGIVNNCPSNTYIVVSQPSVSSSDYRDGASAQQLGRYLKKENNEVLSSIIVPDVIGTLDGDAIVKQLGSVCGAVITNADAENGHFSIESSSPRVIRIKFPAVQTKDRSYKLSQHDSFLNAVISALPDKKYTVIYTTTPAADIPIPESKHAAHYYEMDDPYPGAPHTELKRDLEGHTAAQSSDLPLFEKYQYFTPGIFMGLTVSLPLLMILYVGIRAVASVEVSYFAFSKEVGPAAQKKQG